MISATFTALAKLATSVAECTLRIVYLIGGWGTESEIVRFRRYTHAPQRIPTTKLCNPYREVRRCRIAHHSARMRRVPDDVRTIRANLDARRDPICGRFQSRQMLEDEMPTAARGLVCAGLWKSIVVFMKPGVSAMSQVDVDIIESTRCAGRHANQRAGIKRPQPCNGFGVRARILETVGTGRALVGTAGENGQGAFEQNLAHALSSGGFAQPLAKADGN